MNKKFSIEITPKSILLTIAILFALWLLITLRGVVLLIFIAFSLSSMISPIVDYLSSKKIPKTLTIFFIYLCMLSILILLVVLSYKPIVTQLEGFIGALPEFLTTFLETTVDKIPILKRNIDLEQVSSELETNFWSNFEVSNISDYLVSGVGKAFGLVGSVFLGAVNIVTVIFLSAYFTNTTDSSKQKLIKLIPKRHRQRLLNFFSKVEEQLGSWLRAQLLLMLIIGILGWLGFEIAGMKFSIPMGIIAGLLEIIPNIGPTITWFLAIIVGYGSGVATWKIIFIAIWFIAIQQFENYLIVPKLMQKAVGSNPAITIIAIISLSHPKIFGPIGALIAVPLVAVAEITLRHYLKFRNETK